MKLSRTNVYAIRAMLALARDESGAPMPCSEIAQTGGMPERFLLQILRTLVNRELLRSARGVVGGYRLARPAVEISLADIIDAFDCQTQPSDVLDAFEPEVRLQVLTTFESAVRTARQELQRLTLADLLQTSPLRHSPIAPPIVAPAESLNAGPSGHH